MTIAVTTPTGNVGRHVVAALVRAGVRPRVLLRHPERLSADLVAHVDLAVVDQFDADAVIDETKQVDTLFWVDPPTASEDPLADFGRATKAVTAAIEANAISRVVFQSSVGAEQRQGVGEIDGLAGTEVALDATGADVTHLRCGFFFSNLILQLDDLRAGTVPVILPLDSPMPWVAPRDIGEVAAACLLSPEWHGRCVRAVHGPADLSWAAAMDIVSEAVDSPLRAERISDDAMRGLLQGAGFSSGLTDAVIGMSTGLRDGFVPEQPRTARTTTPTTLGAWAYETLRPLLRRGATDESIT